MNTRNLSGDKKYTLQLKQDFNPLSHVLSFSFHLSLGAPYLFSLVSLGILDVYIKFM